MRGFYGFMFPVMTVAMIVLIAFVSIGTVGKSHATNIGGFYDGIVRTVLPLSLAKLFLTIVFIHVAAIRFVIGIVPWVLTSIGIALTVTATDARVYEKLIAMERVEPTSTLIMALRGGLVQAASLSWVIVFSGIVLSIYIAARVR